MCSRKSSFRNTFLIGVLKKIHSRRYYIRSGNFVLDIGFKRDVSEYILHILKILFQKILFRKFYFEMPVPKLIM